MTARLRSRRLPPAGRELPCQGDPEAPASNPREAGEDLSLHAEPPEPLPAGEAPAPNPFEAAEEDQLGEACPKLRARAVLSELLRELDEEEDPHSSAPLHVDFVLEGEEPQDPYLQEERHEVPEQASGGGRELGIVDKFASLRGFGVIRPNSGGESVFVHWTQLFSHDKWPQLSCGMHVEFTREIVDGRPTAMNVSMPGGGLIVTAEELAKGARTVSPFTMTGTVAWFHKAGYGFIKIDTEMEWPQHIRAGQEIYVSREDLVVAEGSPCCLEEGQRVQFKVYKPPDKDVAAAEVTAVGGAPLVSRPSGAGRWGSGSSGAAPPASLVPKRELPATRDGDEGPPFKLRKLFSSEEQEAPRPPAPKVRKFFGQSDAELFEELLYRMRRASEPTPNAQGDASPVVCKFFLQGRCTKGSSCQFSHRRDPPPEPVRTVPAVEEEALARTSIPCRFFAQGRCRKGASCPFEHTVETSPPIPLEEKVLMECKFFAERGCSRGDACRFAHGPQELVDIELAKALSGRGLGADSTAPPPFPPEPLLAV